jgi:hypothetical protein
MIGRRCAEKNSYRSLDSMAGKLSASQLAAIRQASKDVLSEATQFLVRLVQTDTTNPPGQNYRDIAVLIKDQLQILDYDAELLQVTSHGASFGLIPLKTVSYPPRDLQVLAPHDPELHERVNVMGR